MLDDLLFGVLLVVLRWLLLSMWLEMTAAEEEDARPPPPFEREVWGDW